MLKLGHNKIGNYSIWIKEDDISSGLNSSYFLVLVTQSQNLKTLQVEYYVNLMKTKEFSSIFNVDKDYRPTKLSDMTQYNYYMDHREIQMPLYKLSKDSVISLLQICSNFFK